MTEIVVAAAAGRPSSARPRAVIPAVVLHGAAVGGLGALAWVALKVGALSYGGGFVIVPLMQHDAVTTYHWMTGAQFLNAVALGQVTPGPVVQTVAVVGYAAGGVGGGAAGRPGGLRPFVRLRAARRPPLRPDPGQPDRRRRSSPGRDRPSSAPSPDRPSRSGCLFSTSGRSQCWRGPWSGSWCSAVVWSARLLIAGAVGVVVALAGRPA